LTKNRLGDAHQVREHMQIVESQLARLGEITRKSLSFYRGETEPKEFDLVDIAEAAIRLHLQGPPAGRVATSLFKPYATGKSKGTGVGLWLSRQIMDRHSGTIRFRSSRRVGNSGTVFLLTIPVAQVQDG
jgi:nitrogen-specific signal transduction histidine kinase